MTSRSSPLAPSVGARIDRDAALQVEAEDRRVAERQVDERAATTVMPTQPSSDAQRRRRFIPGCRRTVVGVARRRLRRVGRWLRSASAACPPVPRVDLALDRGRGRRGSARRRRSRARHLSSSNAGDEAVDARRRHHLVADLERRLQRLLLAHPPPLRADHQEVHRQRDEQEDPELDEAAPPPPESSSAARIDEDVHRFRFRSGPDGPGTAGILPTAVDGPAAPLSRPDGQHLGPQRGERAGGDRRPHPRHQLQRPGDVVHADQPGGRRLADRRRGGGGSRGCGGRTPRTAQSASIGSSLVGVAGRLDVQLAGAS